MEATRLQHLQCKQQPDISLTKEDMSPPSNNVENKPNDTTTSSSTCTVTSSIETLPPTTAAATTKESEATTSTSSLRRRVTPYRDNAFDILPYNVHPQAADFKDQLLQVTKAVCPFLENEPHLSITPLSGGLSNELFVLSTTQNGKHQPSVLVRIHPQVEEQHSMVDRAMENRITAWLSSLRIGPTYYGRFQNGRVEEFYSQHVPLSHNEMPVYGASHVAPIMAQFHSLRVPSGVLEPSDVRGDIFHRISNWLQMADQILQNVEEEETPTIIKAREWLVKLQQEWAWYQEALERENNKSASNTGTGDHNNPTNPSPQATAQRLFTQMVFTHMDMQSLNLLRDTNNTTPTVIKVIDFEYAGFNPRAVDMANTFLEHCDMNNIKPNYEAEYPSVQLQNDFIQSYIRHLTFLTTDNVLEHAKDVLEEEMFLKNARQIVGQYTLMSHLSWSVWSIIQSQVSDIDFDYLAYLECRMEGYEYMKGLYFRGVGE